MPPTQVSSSRACRVEAYYDRGLTAINVQQAIGQGDSPQGRNSGPRGRGLTPSKLQIHKVPLECRVPGDRKRQINQRLDLLVQRRRGERPLFGHGVRRRERYLLPLFLFGGIRDGPSALTS